MAGCPVVDQAPSSTTVPNGVLIQPVVDLQNVAPAFFTTVGGELVVVSRMRRHSGGQPPDHRLHSLGRGGAGNQAGRIGDDPSHPNQSRISSLGQLLIFVVQ